MSLSASVLRAASLGLAMLASIVLARILGPAGLGYYSFAMAAIAVIGLPVHMGLPTLIIRETAKAEAEAEWSRLRGLWSWAGRRIWVFSAAMLIMAMPGVLVLGPNWLDGDGVATLTIALILVPLIAIAQVRGAAVRGLHRPVLGLIPDSILRPSLMMALLVGGWWLFGLNSAEGAMIVHVASAALASLVGIWILYRLTPSPVKSAAPSFVKKSEWQKSLLPLALLASTQVLIQNANMLFLGAWASAEEVGLFKIAVSAGNLAILGLTAVNMAIAPIFVRALQRDEKTLLQRNVATGTALAMLAAAPVIAALIFGGRWILATLYGESFEASYLATAILLGGHSVAASFGMSATLMTMAGLEKLAMRVMFIALPLNLLLCVSLIPIYGILGAALATAITTAFWNLAFALIVRWKLGIDATPLSLRALVFRKR